MRSPLFEPSTRRSRSAGLLSVLIGLSACGGDGDGPITGFDEEVAAECLIDLSELQDGGVGRDQIPALTNPSFVTADDPGAAYLRPQDRVVGFRFAGAVFAIPHNILWWHEIVNLDLLDGDVAITYCPLTGTAMAFDRSAVAGAELGVSGLLFRNNLVMFDRNDSVETLFPQIMGEGVCGQRRGVALPRLAVEEMNWKVWKERYPRTLVVSESTGFPRNYQLYPYGDYERHDEPPFLPVQYDPTRLPKERVVGIEGPAETFLALPFLELDQLGEIGTANVQVGGAHMAVIWDRQSQSGIAHSRFAESAVSSERPFVTLEVEDGRIFDQETGSEWNTSGRAIAGPLVGFELPVHPESMVSFWFAWSDFHPTTELWTAFPESDGH